MVIVVRHRSMNEQSTNISKFPDKTEVVKKTQWVFQMTGSHVVVLWAAICGIMIMVFLFGLYAGRNQGVEYALNNYGQEAVRMPVAKAVAPSGADNETVNVAQQINQQMAQSSNLNAEQKADEIAKPDETLGSDKDKNDRAYDFSNSAVKNNNISGGATFATKPAGADAPAITASDMKPDVASDVHDGHDNINKPAATHVNNDEKLYNTDKIDKDIESSSTVGKSSILSDQKSKALPASLSGKPLQSKGKIKEIVKEKSDKGVKISSEKVAKMAKTEIAQTELSASEIKIAAKKTPVKAVTQVVAKADTKDLPIEIELKETATEIKSESSNLDVAKGQQNNIPVGWYIQAGAYRKNTEADVLTARLTKAGKAPLVQRAKVRDKQFFRVMIGPFASKTAADDAMAELQASKLSNGEPFVRYIQ